MIPLPDYLAVGAALFAIGMIGFLTRRHLIVMFLCAELMLQGVAINFVAFSRYHGNMHGQIFTLFLITVAACEAGVALAMIIVLYRRKKSLDVSVWTELRDPGLESIPDTEAFPVADKEPEMPKLPAAGIEPVKPEERPYV